MREAAATIELTNLLDRKPKQLSGGQRQRVALGRAIVREPAVFLMDEPLSNLDAKLRVQTRAEIARLHQRLRTTVVYVTHDQVEAMTMGDRIAVMNFGVLQQVGSPQELYEHPVNKFVAGFIGSPAMNFINVTPKTEGGTTHAQVRRGFELPVPDGLEQRGHGRGAPELTAGVRPEHFQIIDRRRTGAGRERPRDVRRGRVPGQRGAAPRARRRARPRGDRRRRASHPTGRRRRPVRADREDPALRHRGAARPLATRTDAGAAGAGASADQPQRDGPSSLDLLAGPRIARSCGRRRAWRRTSPRRLPASSCADVRPSVG